MSPGSPRSRSLAATRLLLSPDPAGPVLNLIWLRTTRSCIVAKRCKRSRFSAVQHGVDRWCAGIAELMLCETQAVEGVLVVTYVLVLARLAVTDSGRQQQVSSGNRSAFS